MTTFLIDEVRKRPALWDASSEAFRDKNKRELYWQDIANILQKPIAELKVEWKRLRDCHRNAMKRKETKSGQAAANVKPWKYEKNMEFLISNVPPHPTQENNIPPLMDEANESQQNTHDDEEETKDNIADDEEQTRQKETPVRQRPPKGVDKIITFMKEKNCHKNTRAAPDDIDLFFGSAAMSVKKLPRLLQIRIKRQVLDCISQAEEDYELGMARASPRVTSPSSLDASSRSTPPLHSQLMQIGHPTQEQFSSPSPSPSSSGTSQGTKRGRKSTNKSPSIRFVPNDKPSSMLETGDLLRQAVNNPDFYSDHFEDNYTENTPSNYTEL